MLRFCVARIAGILLLLMSFSYYVFAHGTCTSFDTDISKCEILSNQAEPCSDAPHTNENGKSETSFHACGCASIFVPVINQAVYNEFQKTIFGFLKSGLSAREFVQRIERPPIAQS